MIANGVLRNFELAKDASQNAFVKAFFNLKHFREEARFKTWLFRIVMNEAKDLYRRGKSRGRFKTLGGQELDEGSVSILETVLSSGQSPRELFEAQEMKKQLEFAIAGLPEREREVCMLRYFHELSLAEVGETLGVATGTVKAHLAHGVEKLRACFSASGGLFRGQRMTEGGEHHV